MVMPTRFIEKEEFDRLMDQEGNTIPVFKLDAVQFDPPRPDGSRVEPYRAEIKSINILLMNVTDPVIYRDGDGTVFIVLNGYDDDNTMTYASMQDAHPVKGAWAYLLAPHYYQSTDPDYEMAECRWFFDHGEEN